MNLHLIQKKADSLELCLQYTKPIDSLLITGNYLYQILSNMPDGFSDRKVYLFRDDVIALGLQSKLCNFECISYQEFIELSLSHKKVVTW